MAAFRPYKSLLILRFVLFNFFGLALLALAWDAGWLQFFWDRDISGIVALICAIFTLGLLWAGVRVVQASLELDEVRRGYTPLGFFGPTEVVALKLKNRVAPIRHLSNGLVLLGLIGTVLGFTLGLQGVSAEAAANIDAVGPMISELLQGMAVALDTTLVGSILHLWLGVNVRLLEGGQVKLYSALLELREGWSAPNG